MSLTLKDLLSFNQNSRITLKETYYGFHKLKEIASVNGAPTLPDAEEIPKARRVLQYTKKKIWTNEFVYSKVDYLRGRYYVRQEHNAKNTVCFQTMCGKLRRILMQGMYHDIDIKNAHSTILLQLSESLGFPCSALKEYVSHRDEHLRAIMQECGVSKEQAKLFFTIALFGGTFESWKKDFKEDVGIFDNPLRKTDFMNRFLSELEQLRSRFVDVPEYLPFVNIATQVKGKRGRKATVTAMAVMLQEIESKVITSMMNKFMADDVTPCAIIHDGVLVYKNSLVDQDYLRDLEKHIENELGLSLTLDLKNTSPTQDDLDWFELYRPYMTHQEPTKTENQLEDPIDCRWADAALCIFKGKIYQTPAGLMIYDDHRGVWTSDKERDHVRLFKRHIRQIQEACFDEKNNSLQMFSYVFDRMYRMINSDAPIDNDWTNVDRQSGFLCFENGVLDMKEYKMLPHDQKYRFTKRIDREFHCGIYQDVCQELENLVFKKPFTDEEKRVYYMHKLARGVAGKSSLHDREFTVAIGDTSCGKGVQSELMFMALGSYVQAFNAESLVARETSGDSELPWSFALNFYDARIAVSNELNLEKDRKSTVKKLNGNALKKLTGGDSIPMRKLYGQPVLVKNRANIMVLVNDIPEVSPADNAYLKRANYFVFDRTSSDKVTEDNDRYFVSDPSIKSEFIHQPEVWDAFIYLMCKYYKESLESPLQRPESMVVQAKEISGACHNNTDWIYENFHVFEGDRDNWFNEDGVIQWKNIPEEYVIKLDDIYAEFKESNDAVMSKTVFSRDVINKVDGVFLQQRNKKKVWTRYVVGMTRTTSDLHFF